MRTNFTYTNHSPSSLKALLVSCLFILGIGFEANAATYYSITSGFWNSNNTWSLTTNGAPAGAFPVAGDNVIIERGHTITVSANAACASLQLGSPGNMGAGILNFSGAFSVSVSGGVTVGGYGNAFRTGTITFTNGSSITAASLTFGRPNPTPATPNAINMSSGGTLTVGSLVVNTGGGSIVNNWTPGLGTVILNATNTLPNSVFTSFNNLTVNGGTTTLGQSISIGGTLNVNTGTFSMLGNNVTSVAAVSLNGTSITGSGTLTLSGDVTNTGVGAVATIGAPINLNGATRTFNVNDGAAIPDLLLSGIITGTGGIIKAGTGSLNLAAVNTYTGNTAVNAGTLRTASVGGAIPDGSALTITGTMDLNGNDESVGSIAGGGTITSGVGGNMTLTTGGDNTNTAFSGIIQNGTGTLVSVVKNGSGTLTLSGSNTYTGGTLLNAGGININNSNALGAPSGAFTIAGGTINNTTGGPLTLANYPQAWNGDFTFTGTQSLNLGAGPVTLTGNRQVTVTANTLTVGGLVSGGFNLTKAGAGTLNLGSNAITLNSLNVNAGTLISTSGTLSLTGDLAVAGSFTHNNGTVNYNGASAQSVGSVIYNNLTMSGAGQKNAAGSVTTANLNNASVFDMAANTLSVSGVTTNTGTIRFSGGSNGLAIPTGTIEYYGGPQNIEAGTYNNLTINQSGGEAILSGNVSVNGTLNLAARNLNLNGHIFTLGSSASAIAGGGFSSSKMIIAVGGSEIRKVFAGVGSYSFPIGDNTGSLEYSPITVSVNAGTFGTPYIGVSVMDAKHPNNVSSTHFLSRYWNVTNSGITNATITANYLAADINGVEASIGSAQLNGTFNQLTNGWAKYTALGGSTLTATNAPLTSGQLSSFTGITGASPVVSITGGGATICVGESVGLTASVTGGDPSIIYSWSPAAGLSATTLSNPTATPIITTAYTVSIIDGNGILATSPASTITVDQIPTVSDAGANRNFCGTAVTLAANTPGVGSGTWSFAPLGNPDGLPSSAFSNTAAPNSTFTGTSGQTYLLRWTISNGTCTSSIDDVQIVFETTPSIADAGLPGITQCNASTFIMNATVPVVGTGTWTVSSGTATITNTTSATTTITGITAGNTATLTWTVGNGTCLTTFDNIVLTNDAPASVANAGLDQPLCNTSNFTLSGNIPTTGIGTWSYVSGFAGITITTPGSNVSTVIGLTAGNSVTLRWTISNGACASTQDDVTLTNNATPSIANAGLPSITQCNASTFIMNATVPAIGTGAWTVTSGTATITNATSATTTITGITAGNTATLTWTVVNGSCTPGANLDNIVLTNNASAPVANAGSDQTLCTTSNFTLSGNAPSPGTGTWSYVSGFAGITITTPGSNVSTVTGLTAGNSVTLRWTISNGSCASTQDDVTLTNQASPSTADAGLASINQCNTSTFIMNAPVPAVGIGTWTVFAGSATITNTTSATTTITGIASGSSATLRWTVVNGSCTPASNFDDIILTNLAPAPTADAGLDQTLCNTANFTMNGNTPSPGTGSWSYVSGFAGIVITTPGSNVSTVTGLTIGNSVTLRWTISNGACASTQDDVTLTNQAAPSTADAGLASITQCNTGTFIMNATVPVIGIGTWTVFAGTATITNAISATTTITGIAAGTTATLRWTVANGSCAPAANFDDIILTNNAATPTANAGLDQTLCNTSTFTLAGNVATPGIGSWVIQSGPGTVTTPSSPTSTVSGVTAGGGPTVVRWTISNGVCGSFDEVVLVNNVNPFITAPSNQDLCAELITTPVSFTGNAAQYSWTNNQPSIGLPANGVGNIGAFTALNSTGSPVVATILVTPTTGICTGTPQSFTYTVNPIPVINPIANIATGTGVVVGPISLTASTSGGETFTWSGGAVVGLADGSGSSPIPSFTTLNSGVIPISSAVSVSAVKGGCPGPVTNFNITIYPIPGALAGDQNICNGDYSGVLITGTVVGTTFTWTVGAVTGTVSGQGPGSGSVIAQQLTSLAGGVVEYIIIPTANGVDGPPTSVFVGVLATPQGNSVSAGTHITCSGTTLNITPTSNVAGTTFAWTGSNGSGGSGNITDAPINGTNNPINITYTVIPTGPGTTFCVGSPFTIVVTVNPNPIFTATNSTPTICSGSSTSILFNSSTTGHQINVVSVSYNGAGGGSVVPGTTTFTNGNTLSEALTNSTSTPIDVVYTFNVTTPSSSPVCPLVPVNQVVTVRVYPVPTALASSQSICSGSTSNVVITNPNAVAGTTFSWTLGTVTGTVSGQSAGSGTTISQTLTSVLGGSVQYIITPIANGCAGTPLAPITVTVNPIPVGNSVAAGTHEVCSGTSLNITPTLSAGTGTFTWSGSNGSGGSGNITDAPINGTNNPINITYTVIPRGPGTTFCVGSPFTIVVSVNPNPIFTATNSTPMMCSGSSTSILFNSSTTGHQINVVSVSYNGAGGGSVVPGTTTFTNGNTLSEALTNSTSAPIDVVYTFNVTTPSSSPVCPLVPVNQVVTVRVYPVPTALASSQSICSGSTSNVVITNPNAVAGTTFSWTLGTVTGTVSGQSAGSGTTISQTLTSVLGGSVQYIITPIANGCAGTPLAPITVTVNPIPVGNSVAAGTHEVCSGTSLNITPTLSAGTGTFTWSGSNGSGGSGNITDAPINGTNNPINITYTVIPRGPGTTFCVGSPFTIVVSVNPNPSFTATNSTPTICSGSSTSILFNSSTTGHQINVVSVSYNGAGGGAVVPGTTTFTNGNTLSEALTNSTSAPIDVVYTFNVTTPSSSPVCPLVPVNQVVTVRVYPVPTALASSQSICSGSTSNVVITNPNAVAGTTFSWTLGTVTGTVSGQSAGSGTTISQTLTSALGGSVQYIITPIANGCAGTPLAPITVTVNPIPVGNSVAAGMHEVCSGTSLNITPTLSAGTGTFTWSGSNGSGGSGNITDAPINGTNNPINITYTVIPTGPGTTFCVGSPFTIVVSVNPNPIFTATNSTPTICSGSNTNILFNSSTTGHQINVVSVSYNGAGGGAVVPGTTTFTNGNTLSEALTNSTSAPIDVVYTFNVTTPSSSPVCPLVPVNQVVTVRVYPVPTALASSQSICSGSSSNVVITNPNTVAGTTFSWTLGTVTGTVSGQSAGSGTTISQTLTSALGGSVQYIITPIANGCAGTPLAPITVTVNPIPVGNSVAAGMHEVCSGTSLNITPTLSAGTGTFTWSGSNGSGGSGNITDAPINGTNNPINITYTVIPTGPGTTFCVGSPFTIVVSVNPNPIFTATNSTPTICSGSSTSILFNSSTTGHQINVVSVSYNGAGGGSVVPGTTTFTNGNTLSEALTNSTSTPIDVVYTFNVTTPSSSPVCPLVPVNQVVTVRVYPVPNASATTPQTICSGTTTNVVITNPNVVAGTTFTWTVVGASNVTGATAGSGTLINQLLTSTDGVSTGSLTYRIVPSANGCAGNPFDVVMNVTPKTVITNPATDFIQDICSATALNFIPTSSVVGTTYTWTSSVIGTLTGVSASGSGAITDTPVNTTNTNAVIIYTITPSFSSCAGNLINVVVTVHPVPTAAASNQLICSNSSPAIVISNPNAVTGTTYSWSVSSSSNVTGALPGTGSIIDQVLTSTDGLTNGTVNYSIIPSANGCAGLPIIVSVTVKPIPFLTNAAASFSQQICSEETLNFIPTASIVGTSFTWSSVISGSISAGSVSVSGSGSITDTPINTGNTSGTVRYIITPTLNSCSGLPMDLIVTVKPLPSASGTNVTICSGENAIFTISPTPVNVSGTTFSWTASASANVIGATNGNGSTINQILSTNNALVGTVSYSITPSANGCNGPITILTANVNPKAIVDAGVDFSVCETLTFPTTMTVPISGSIGGSATSGTWTVVSGTGSISTSTTSGTTVTATYTVGAGDIASQVTFRLTTTDPDAAGPCMVVSDDLVMNVNRRARVALPSDFTICEPTSISLSGTLSGSATSGLWSLVSPNTGTLSSSSVTGSIVNASYLTALPADVSTTLIFRLTTNDPDGFGPCTNEFANINIHINESAKVNAGFDFEVCEDQVVNLNGSFSGSTSSVIWSGGSGSSQFGNVNNAITTYTLTPIDIAGGSITLTLSTNDPDGAGPCVIVSDAVTVKVNKLPAVFIFGVETTYAQNAPIDHLDGIPLGGTFTGPGIVAGTNQFNPANAGIGPLTITYTYIDPITGCDNFTSRSTIVNPVTSVDFYVKEDNRPDVNGFPQICANNDQLTLIGIPPVGTPGTTAFFTSLSPVLTPFLINVANNWYINTNDLPSGVYQLQYTFTNIFSATTMITKDITVFEAPKAVIDVTDNCLDAPVTFLQSSYMADGSPSSNIVTYDWLFGEGTIGSSGSVAEPVYEYTTAGSHTVTLKVTTGNNEFCSNTATKTITIGTAPLADFMRSSFCKGDVTVFQNNSSLLPEYGTINSYLWDFDEGGATSTDKDPAHTYSGFGTFNVKLTIGTDAGCSADTTKSIFIVDSPPALLSDGYSTDFESGNGTWVSVVDYDLLGDSSSWKFGQPDGDKIYSAASGTNAWWTGANNQSFYSNEKSYVIGPCLNIQNLKRPMISLNYWSDTQKGFDGAVLQYSDDSGLSWKPIGDANGAGINWYNTRDLPGKPGGQDNFAWSDTLGGWRNARFNLEEIDVAKRDLVVFRIAFGSNTDNTGRKYNGFAFDDIYIGEKQRNVLVEHFTNNASIPSGQADDYLDRLYNRSFNFQGRDSSDVINLQYHIGNPGKDQINADNTDDPSARRLYYGVSQPPFSIMDGIVGQYYNTNFNGSYAYITDQEIDRRALEDPTFNIVIDTVATNNSALNLSLQYTYANHPDSSLTSPVILHAALVESGVSGKRNYLRKLLLQAEGKYIDKTWNNGTQEIVPVNYTIDVPIAYPDSLSIIAFVQDKNSGKILQSAIRKISRKIGSTVVGVEDDPALAEIAGLNIYPNPVSNTLNLQLENNLHNDYAWKMIDQRGVVVLEGNLDRDLTSPQKVDVSRLADGIYFMAIQSGEKSLVYRKIAVINRN